MKACTRHLRSLTAYAVLVLACVRCSPVNGDASFVITPPDRDQFTPVGAFLVQRCGSLDCHGQIGRNLRVYGVDGLRLAATDIPGLQPTTLAEYDADYQSAVWLEPEVMSQVVTDHGAHPERLTLIEKPRGADQHKGGTLILVGDKQDVCMTSWLTGATDQAACQIALMTP